MNNNYQIAILKAWEEGAFCKLCGKPLKVYTYGQETEVAATLDHIIPAAYGGLRVYENLRLAHRKCNGARTQPFLTAQQIAQLDPEIQAVVRRRREARRRKRKRERLRKLGQSMTTYDSCPWICGYCEGPHPTQKRAFECCGYGWRPNL